LTLPFIRPFEQVQWAADTTFDGDAGLNLVDAADADPTTGRLSFINVTFDGDGLRGDLASLVVAANQLTSTTTRVFAADLSVASAHHEGQAMGYSWAVRKGGEGREMGQGDVMEKGGYRSASDFSLRVGPLFPGHEQYRGAGPAAPVVVVRGAVQRVGR
jgi:hypothetical protein